MGAFRGSISYSKFHVRGEVPEDFRDAFVKSLDLRAFKELDPGEEAEFRHGWCSVEQPFDVELTSEKVFFNDYLCLGFRTDTWRIPSPLFKASFGTAEREYLATHGGEKLTRSQKKNLEVVVYSALKRKLVPAMRVVDVSWSLSEGVLRFFSQSAKQHEAMAELFEQTFELELVPDGAYVAAEQRGMREQVLDAMVELEPTPFHDPATKAAIAHDTTVSQDDDSEDEG